MIAMDGARSESDAPGECWAASITFATKLRMLGLVRHVQTGLASVAQNPCRCPETVRTSKDIGETRLP